MHYELRFFDITLIRFDASEDSDIPSVELLWLNEECKELLPIDLKISAEGLSRWLRDRSIP